ncbi:MAG: hypothetical protein U0703_27450 [Anaerolineae bacterium]
MRILRSEWDLIRQPPADGLRPYHPADQDAAISLIQQVLSLPDRETARAKLRRWWRQIDADVYGYQVDGALVGLATIVHDPAAVRDMIAATPHHDDLARLAAAKIR